tara:strand:- start:1181 stop:1477 length:297 start_codon:yes stop_codon:yes gene_type:complete
MAMEKRLQSNEVVIIGGKSDAYQPGYRYLLGDTIYTVVKAFRADNTEMRMLKTSKGDVQTVTLATIKKDAREYDFNELKPEKMEEEKEENKKEAKPKK